MKLTQTARQHLLDSMKLLSNSTFVKFSHANQHSMDSFQVGELSKSLRSMREASNTDFAVETHHSLWQHVFAFTLNNPQHLMVSISKDAPVANKSQEQRRNSVIQLRPGASVQLEFICDTEFPSWLSKIATEQPNQEISPEQNLFFHHCMSLLSSFEIFSQYHVLTEDSLTKLKSRMALQRFVDDGQDFSSTQLCMIHCRDFQIVNRKFGQAKGDKVLTEIANILNKHTRADDLACRFGGALFGIAFANGGVQDATFLAQKLQTELHAKPYLDNATRLTFDVGVASIQLEESKLDSAAPSALLVQRAEQALKAAQSSDKPSIVSWQADKFTHDEQEFNYLGGIFTPDNITNYRNMLLLWDISSIIADEHDFKRLLMLVVERLASTFEFSFAGVISLRLDDPIEQCHQISQMADVESISLDRFEDKDTLRSIATDAIKDGQQLEQEYNQNRYLAIPLGSSIDACFYLVGDSEAFTLSHDTVMLFTGFARQVGKALKRSQLEDELNQRLEQQNAKLEAELNTLKTGLSSSALVYRSALMQKIVHQTQRAAQTNTTVLITGESGTGKEKLIHAVHSLGPRSQQPLVIVDCGSIPETLIESELFGHVKGAFTGAQSQSIGKIKAADGGVLVLDEIGELPLAMQPKLLRFVQEKVFTPVGSNQVISVDIKIVAVTNRDLAQEVRLGRFREDLYYRLNVVSLHSPPLRKRLDDLELLSRHFLSKFSSQFETPAKLISSQALEKMQEYAWPGNIRELENTLMQANLLCQHDVIEYEDLNLAAKLEPSEHDSSVQANSAIVYPFNVSPQAVTSTSTLHDSQNEASINRASINDVHPDDWIASWETALETLVVNVCGDPKYYQAEIGTWLEHRLFQQAMAHCKTNKRIASLLHLPISTARRKAQKALSFNYNDFPSAWSEVEEQLAQLASGEVKLTNPLHTIKVSLLRIILQQNGVNMTQAAQLLGVSEPTLYKLKREL